MVVVVAHDGASPK